MGLADLAEGIEVTTEQRDRGVAAVDRTPADLADRLGAIEADFPCDGATAATLVEAYAEGRDVAAAAAVAELPPITAAKTLHRLGEAVTPLSPAGRAVVEDWLDGRLPRHEALALAGCSEVEFALAVYVATHEPHPAGRAALEGALTDRDATGDRRARLGDAVEAPGDGR
jgi:hypothetical protein